MIVVQPRAVHADAQVRLFDPARDFAAVTDLITVAFGDQLDPAGRAALAEMRRALRWGWLFWWFTWSGWDGAGGTSGLVWAEGERVVGNVSFRRALGWGGYLIGNVAVHPEWQGRGIATALMRAAIDHIVARGGHWVGLEVRADNQVACHVYDRLGFCEVGKTLHMVRPVGLRWEGDLVKASGLRRGRRGDSRSLIELAMANVPKGQRPLLELRREEYRPGWEYALDHWIEGRRQVWWVIEEGDRVCGAVRAVDERGQRPGRLEVLISPGHQGRFESLLVQRGIGSLHSAARRAVEIVLPSPTQPLTAALRDSGFRKLRVLVQMRLDVRQSIAIRGGKSRRRVRRI